MVRSSAVFACVFLSGLIVVGCGDSKRSNAFASLPPGLQITTSSLPNGNAGSAYNQTLEATNGQAPYTWAVISGSLPSGLDLDTASGLVSGTPTTSGSSSFRTRVTDGAGTRSERDFLILVGAAPVQWNPGAGLNPGTVGQQYGTNLNQSVSGGTQPITFEVVQGALPPGITLTQAGFLSGTPTQAGSYQITFRATSAPDPSTGARSQADLGTTFVVN